MAIETTASVEVCPSAVNTTKPNSSERSTDVNGAVYSTHSVLDDEPRSSGKVVPVDTSCPNDGTVVNVKPAIDLFK